MYLISVLKVETFETKFELLIFSDGCMFIHSPLFENIKKTSLGSEVFGVCTYTCKLFQSKYKQSQYRTKP